MIEVILDTDTTGLSVKDGHRIVEIGCIELNDLIPTKKTFHCYLNPQRKVSESALKVHGYTDEFLSGMDKFKDVADKFLSFIEGKKIVIHNAEFDLSHLNNELVLAGYNKIDKINVVDTLEIARNKYPGSSASLDALCRRYKIDNSKRKKHNALLDCELLSKVYINLLDQKEPSLRFNESEKKLENENSKYQNIYSKKIIKISEQESQSHKIFLKSSLKKNHF